MKRFPLGCLLCLTFNFSSAKADAESFLSLRVPEFRVEKATMQQAVEQLLRNNIQICIERLAATESASHNISITLKDASIREILETLIRTDSRYTWEIYNGLLSPGAFVINIIPVDAKKNANNFMNIKVKHARLRDLSPANAISLASIWILELATKLHPDGVGGSILSGRGTKVKFFNPDAEFEDMTVREILNEVILRSGGLVWIYEQSQETGQPIWKTMSMWSPK